MFQFSEDIDEDLLENVLSISTSQTEYERKTDVNTLNGAISCNVNGFEPGGEADSNITLKDFDDDDLILSAFEDTRGPLAENTNASTVSTSLLTSTSRSIEQIIPASQVLDSSKNSDCTFSDIVTKHKSSDFSGAPNYPKYSKIEYERKFPGPAGLIAKKSRENAVVLSENLAPLENHQFENHHTGDSFLDNSPSWRMLFNDVSSKSNKLHQTVKEFTISNVKRLNLVKHASWKIPVCAAVIYNLDSSVCDPSVTLKDPSGEIRGTLHKDLWEQYNHLLLAGSALLMRQVSVMSIINSRKLYLNITTNNIVTIYTPPTDDKSLTVTHITTVTENDLLNESKTDKNARLVNVPTSNVTSVVSPCQSSKTRSNADLLNLMENSNFMSCSNSCGSLDVGSMRHSPADFDSKSTSVGSSAPIVAASVPELNPHEVNNSSLILSELEGVDADSLFDDF